MARSRKSNTRLKLEWEEFLKKARPQRLRSMADWACSEIYLPDGPFEGQRFKLDRQPHAKIWFDEAMNTHWLNRVITGPSQSGKSLIGFVIPVLYHLFERGDKVIAAVPDYELVKDKWTQDLLPALERTRYREFLPKTKVGGKQATVQFTNGAVLRFMTAGGSDKSRAGYTAPVICFTETDGFDSIAETSDESSKIEQILARSRSYSLDKRTHYMECTVSTEDGFTWANYQNGTESKLMLPCQHCGEYVCLERENFFGHQEAKSDAEASRGSFFACNACGEMWEETDRIKSNNGVKLVHRGQEIDKNGNILGELPDTHTLGFRWSAVNNCLYDVSKVVGIDEFKARTAIDTDNEHRKMSQFVWSVPYRPLDTEEVVLTMRDVSERAKGEGRGVCPDGTEAVTVGIDVNRNVLHWTATAWYVVDGVMNGRIIDFGKQGTKFSELGDDKGLIYGLSKLFYEVLGSGWSNTPNTAFNLALVDSRWIPKAVINAIKNLKDKRFMPFMGEGGGHWQTKKYAHPDQHSKKAIWMGTQCHIKLNKTYKAKILMGNSDYWKGRVVTGFKQEDPTATTGRLTMFETTDHAALDAFAKQLTAEREVINFEKGKGQRKEWLALRSSNHYLDSTMMSLVAANRLFDGKDISKLGITTPRQDNIWATSKKEVDRKLSLGQNFNPFKGRR